MKKLFSLILIFPLFFLESTIPLLDLEMQSQDFVLETKKIEIPGYPLAFNAGIVRWQDRLLLSFRIIPDRKQSFNAEIGLVWLNEDFSTASEPQLLSFRDEYTAVPCRAEDGRLITIDDRLFVVYDDNIETKITKGGFRVFVAELHYDGEHFIADPIECLSCYEGASREVREKSWTPFVYKGNLLLAYSLNPHLIFRPRLDGSGICDTIAQTFSPIDWDWGILRGGTPGLRVGDQYLSFFHSSKSMATLHSEGKPITHYFIGAYTFSAEPPFAMTAISKEPIIGKNFYKGARYKPYWNPIRCVFPCGFVFDKQFIWITYGRDDHETWVVKIDKEKLLNSLYRLSK